MEQKKRLIKGNIDSDGDDFDNANNFQKKDGTAAVDPSQQNNEQNMIEQFQNVLEYKIVEMLSDQKEEEANFYT